MANGNGGIWATLMQQGFTPQQIQQLMQLGVLEEEGDIISQEMSMANRLRERQMPGGRYAGRAYVAGHPLEFMATGMDRLRGEMAAQDAIRRQREAAQEKARLRAQFLQQMGMGARSQTPRPGMTPPPGPAPTPSAAQTYAYGTNPGTPTSGWQ